MAKPAMIIAEKNGQVREFGPVQWKRMKEADDGTHLGWRELPEGTKVGPAPTFIPPEIMLPPAQEEKPAQELTAQAPAIQEEKGQQDFSDINGPGNDADASTAKVNEPAEKVKGKPGPKAGSKKTSK